MTTHTITHGELQRITFQVFGQERHLEFHPPQCEPFAILEALARKLDVFVATAMVMADPHPEQCRHIERATGLVVWLDIQRPDEPSAAAAITKMLPRMLYLCGRETSEHHAARMVEWKSITAMNNALLDAIERLRRAA